MRARDLARLTRQSLRRHARTYVLSSIGIVAGIAAFTFFVGLTQGVRSVVLGRIFPVDRLEVVPRTFDMGPLQIGGVGSSLSVKLDDAAVGRIRALPGVEGAWPKQKLSFKTMGWAGGDLFGRDVRFEVFADGIDPSLLDDDPELAAAFGGAAPASEDTGPPCDPARGAEACEAPATCAADTRHCADPIPVLVNPHLLEMYNGSAVRAFGVPRLSPDTLVGLTGTLQFGRSFAGVERGKPVLRRKAVVVGISDKAILFGATMPIAYVRHFNAVYNGEAGAGEYDSLVVRVGSAEEVGAVAEAVAAMGFDLDERSRVAERAGLVLSVVALTLSLIALAVLGIAAIHVTHVFFMLVLERRRELALLRALGASRSDMRRLVLAEAVAVGLAAGLVGSVLARVSALGLDLLAARTLPDFPYRPDTFFAFPAWLLAAGVGLSVLFCVAGAAMPAVRASRAAPARALMGG